jgi:hypothetical protein
MSLPPMCRAPHDVDPTDLRREILEGERCDPMRRRAMQFDELINTAEAGYVDSGTHSRAEWLARNTATQNG